MRLTSLTAALLLAGCATLGHNDPGKALHALIDEDWQAQLADDPYYATQLGIPGHNHRHPDVSPEAIARSQAGQRARLERLNAIARESLSEGDRINYDLFRASVEDGAGNWSVIGGTNGHRFHPQQLLIDPLTYGPQHFPALLPTTPFDNAQDYQDYLARLESFGTYVDQVIGQLRAGMASGRTQPRPAIERIVGQAKSVAGKPAAKHELYAPFTRIPATIPATAQKELQAAATRAMEASVLPAYRRYHAFLKDEYLPAARTTIGASDLPDGADYYAYCIRRHTTTTLTADEIHEIGLREAERLRQEMRAVMKEAGFRGSIAAFGDKLRKDPKQVYKTGAQALAAHRAMGKELDAMMPRVFGTLPRLPYGVEPMPEAAALSGGAPYYNPPSVDGSRGGVFFINTHRPELQPAYTMPSLVAHEAVPGHHLQSALAQELSTLPPFRQNAYYTAYGEGWALYAEGLAGELGAYRTPAERFGALSNQMWRAVRLVVDTGMHAKGWSRDRAVKYFAENAAEPVDRVEAEIDRYIAWPGQALGYMMGNLKIRELRTRAESALGGRFDLRAFHDELLGAGAMPLSTLEQRMDAWIAKQKI